MCRGERRLGLGLGGFRGFDLLGEFFGARQLRRALVGGRGAHALAGGFLFGAQRVGGRNRGPAGGVGRQQGVHQRRVFATAELGTAHGVGVFPEQLQVDHGRKTTFGCGPVASDGRALARQSLTQHRQHLSRGRGGPVRMEPMSDTPEEAVPTGESEPIGEPVADPAADLAGAPADDASPRARRRAHHRAARRASRARRGTGGLAGRLSLATCVASDDNQARAAAHRPRWPADRRAGDRDTRRRHRTRAAGRLYRQRSGSQHRHQEQRRLQPRRQRRLPDVAGRQSGCREHRQLHRRPSLRGRRVPRHADVPRLGVRVRRRSPVAGSHSTDHPGAMRSRGAPVHGRPSSTPTASSASACCGPGTGRGASRATAACCAGCNNPARTTSRPPSRARLPTSTSPRSGRPAIVWVSTRLPTSRSTFRSTARRRTRWR